MRRVIFQRKNGGLGRQQPSEDGISGLILNAVAVATTFNLNEVYELRSLGDVEDLGITAEYDATNKILVHYHIAEFFRINNGAILYIMGVAQSVTMTQMCDKDNAYLKKLLTSAEGKIRQVAVVRNPSSGYTPTISTGLDADVLSAIPKADQLSLEEESYYRPVEIILEGKYFTGTPASAIDLHTLDNSNVSVVILADNDISTAETEYQGYAAVGTVLGCVSLASVNENIGWAEKFNIQSSADERFVNVGLSSGLKLSAYTEAQQQTLNDKGFIIPELIIGEAGVYLNDSYTCTSPDDDFAYIENNRTIKKAIRLVYKALAPKVKRPTKVDKNTGYLPTEVIKFYQTTAKSAMEVLLRNNECSDVDAFMNPKQNLLATNELVVEIEIIPTGTARKIKVPIGFNNPFKA
jgi:hypothetical protein